MSSIRRVQTERILKDVVHSLYSQGTQPTFGEVAQGVARYFEKYPAGKPLPLPLRDAVARGQSDEEAYNQLLSFIAINLDVLYESSLRQVEEVIMLTSSLQTHLDRLSTYRKRIDSQIEDYLLGVYNTDGYFYSVSDNFSDIDFVDLNMTTGQVDTVAGMVSLPSVSGASSRVPTKDISRPRVSITVGGRPSRYDELASFTGALEDSLENIVWAFEVESATVEEVVAVAVIDFGTQDPVRISRVDITPYGATPVQVFMEYLDAVTGVWNGFGNKIHTGTSLMVFGGNVAEATSMRLTLRKTKPDYTENKGGQVVYKYIFGARDLAFAHKVYDYDARIVSTPRGIPDEYAADLVIDAVSLDAEENIPADTDIRYYIGASQPDETYDDIVWREISPIRSAKESGKIVRFDGATKFTRKITENPAAGDLKLLPLISAGTFQQRNPNQLIIPGVDIYRIAHIEEEVLLNSMELVEGVNTTKIHSRSLDTTTSFDDIDISYWGEIFDSGEVLTIDYGRIDTGNEFFYGGDVGSVGKDIYIETFIDCDTSYQTFLEEFQKIDVRAQTWDVKVFLNGKPTGVLKSGTNKLQMPWTLQQGLNHIVVMVRIPNNAVEDNAFIGALNLMSDKNLYDFGKVHLAKWNYVDFFAMQYNEYAQPKTFTMHNGEIISRRKPTTNFELRYATSTGTGPENVRLRIDMSRSRNTPNVTPSVDSYRLRFSYEEEDG